MDAVSPYYLGVLSKDDCLSVFAQYALGKPYFIAYPNLQAIGIKIANQCKGLPLAAKTYGEMLRNKQDYDEWEITSDLEIWDSAEERSDIFPALCIYHKTIFYGSQQICTIICCTVSSEESD